MALYTMADLHLSFSTAKPMDVFGDRWKDHPEKIAQRWQLTDQDTIVLPGDFSWAIDLNELRADMAFLDALPGKKILSKGNHDYWWETMAKLNRFIATIPRSPSCTTTPTRSAVRESAERGAGLWKPPTRTKRS